MSEADQSKRYEESGFRADRIPYLPEPAKSRQRFGEDLQPVGDCAEIEPYYRVCEDVGNLQHQEQSDSEAFASGDW